MFDSYTFFKSYFNSNSFSRAGFATLQKNRWENADYLHTAEKKKIDKSKSDGIVG